MGIVENLRNVAQPHKRQTSAPAPGQAPNNSDGASPLQKGKDAAQKPQHNAFAEILQLLYKNSFIRDLGQENMMKLAAEM